MSAGGVPRREALARIAQAGLGLGLLGCGQRSSPPSARTGEPPHVHASAPATQAAPPSAARPTTQQRRGRQRRGLLLGAGRVRQAGAKDRFVLSAVDLDARSSRQIALGFYGHGLAFDPRRPTRALLFEKHGPGCCELDLAAMRVVRPVKTVSERQFYGHGVFTRGGDTLLATETVVADGSRRGVIAIRDGKTLALRGTFPSYGLAPHDCHLVDGGRTLVVTNGGGRGTAGAAAAPNVARIDVASQRLLERVPFDDQGVNAGHVAVSSRGDLAVVSAPRDGLDASHPEVHGQISFRPAGATGPLRAARSDVVAKMRAETLSVAIHEATGVVAATSPEGGLVSFWDLRTGKLLGTLDRFSDPRGVAVTLDGARFALTWGAGTGLALIDPRTLQPVDGEAIERSWISGSHVYAHAG